MSLIRMAAAFCALTLGSMLHAADPVQMQNSNALWFENWVDLSHGNLRVASPDGKIIDVYEKRGTPVYRLKGGDVQDGVYRYELRATVGDYVEPERNDESGELDPEADDSGERPLYITGSFTVERGVIIKPAKEDETEEKE